MSWNSLAQILEVLAVLILIPLSLVSLLWTIYIAFPWLVFVWLIPASLLFTSERLRR